MNLRFTGYINLPEFSVLIQNLNSKETSFHLFRCFSDCDMRFSTLRRNEHLLLKYSLSFSLKLHFLLSSVSFMTPH
jgi:hypothetical protein